MTREEEIRNAIDTTFPIPPSEKGRTYEQALMATGFENGVKWSDTHPKSPWINYKEEKPPFGVEVIAYHHKWVDEDFNPNGTRIGFLSDDGFISAFWWDNQDCYETISKPHCNSNNDFYKRHIDNTEPEFWFPIPRFPKLPKRIGDKNMTCKEYQKKINELNEQKDALNAQIRQVNKEFRDTLLRELEEQGITPGTKVLVKSQPWLGDEIDTETYFFDVSLVWGNMTYVFHKIKKDGTMSQIKQFITGKVISIHKI